MRVQYISNACVVISHDDTRVLCDPWLVDGAFYGSWYHWPKLTFTPEDFADVDYIFISHIHPDHLDPKTLARLPKTIPVIIHEFQDRTIARILHSLGFLTVYPLRHREILPLGFDFSIQIYAADNNDPARAARFFGLAQLVTDLELNFDSIAVFRGGGYTVTNVNDCPYSLSAAVCDQITDTDLLLVNYAGAGPYPQCFAMSETAMKEAADKKRNQFLDQTAAFISHLKPRYYMPFAGQYVLAGRLVDLNDKRGVPDIDEIPDEMEARGIRSEPIPLSQGGEFNLETQLLTGPYKRVEQPEYIESLRSVLFDYETGWNPAIVLASVELARAHMWTYQERFHYFPDTELFLDTGRDLFGIPLNLNAVYDADEDDLTDRYIRIELASQLLNRLIAREAHWNNAENGCHLRFDRKPDTYDRMAYHLLSYLHA